MHRVVPRPRLTVLMLVALAPVMLRAQGLPRGDARAEGFDPGRLGRVEARIQDAVGRREVAGAAVLIAHHGKTVLLATDGQRIAEDGTPMSEDTIFRIASMTKPITSTAVLMLVDDGRLRLDDPVSKYLPEFAAPVVLAPGGEGAPLRTVPAERPITVHHLLTHTAGLSYRFANPPRLGPLYVEAAVSDGLSETPGTIGDNVRRLARLPLLHQPGSVWDYSLATDVLGRLVEVVSGRTLDEFFRERIFEPLKMTDTHFLLPEPKRRRLAVLYGLGEGGTLRRVGDQMVQDGPLVYSATFLSWDDTRYFSGGAGLASTIGDYARFLQMLLNRGELDGARLLRPETVEAMTRSQVGDRDVPDWKHGDGFGYGFGVVTEADRHRDVAAPGTFSWGGFFYTYFWVDPRNELIGLLMTQTYPNGHLTLREDVKRLTYEALVE